MPRSSSSHRDSPDTVAELDRNPLQTSSPRPKAPPLGVQMPSNDSLGAESISGPQPDLQHDPLPQSPPVEEPSSGTPDVETTEPSQSRLARLIAMLLVKPRQAVPQPRSMGAHHFRGIERARRPGPPSLARIFRQRSSYNNHDPTASLSMARWLDRVPSTPWVLDSKSLTKGQALECSVIERQRLFLGHTIAEGPSARPVLDFTHDAPEDENTYNCAFDVDSYIALADSLAIARHGLKLLTVQKPTPSFKASMHLGPFRVHYHDDDGDAIATDMLPIHEIPQVSLGRFMNNDDLEVMLVFPHAVRRGQKIAKFPDELWRVWADEVLLPAIHAVLPANLSRMFPASDEMAQSSATLRHSNSLRADRMRIQLLSYSVQGKYLGPLWREIQARIRVLREVRFDDIMIIVCGKGMKASMSHSTWQGMRRNFDRRVNQLIDPRHRLLAWIDVGKEWTCSHSALGGDDHGPGGESAVWSLQYLDNVIHKLRRLYPDTEKSKLQVRDYPQYFLQGLGSCTVEPLDDHPMRNDGLIYAQWYNTVKDLFAAGDSYLAQNPATADMGLDPKKLAALRHAANAVTASHEHLVDNYLHIKRHVDTLTAAQGKSHATREEYRVRHDLWNEIDSCVHDIIFDSRKTSLKLNP